MEFHKILDLFTAVGAVLMPVAAFVWKNVTARMHAENLEVLNGIRHSITLLGAEVSKHTALDDVKHDDFERRIDRLEH